MCELFAMSASVPVDVTLSLSALALRGGATGRHADGWGVAFLEGNDCMLFVAPRRRTMRLGSNALPRIR